MRNWKFSSSHPEVVKYIECYWYLENLSINPDYTCPKLNPDPCGHLILADVEQGYHYERNAYLAKGTGNHWLFPYSYTYTMDHSHAFQILGIKFHVGALYSLISKRPHLVLNQVLALDAFPIAIFNRLEAAQVLSKANAGASAQSCCDLLDILVLPWITQIQPDKHSQLVQSAVPLLLETPVSEIGEALYCSQRTLERSFSRVTGLTLKQCQSMIRMETLLEHLHHLGEQDINWSEIAYEFGFTDQPHLIRFLKKSLGETPGQYMKQRDFAIDVYGDFEGP